DSDHVTVCVRRDAPFLARKRKTPETPSGWVIVKPFWNRLEREFPYVDKIRPMSDSVTALLMQRPTFFLVKFDHFVDLFLGAWLENLRGLLARRPRAGLPPPPDTPEAVSRRLWRKHSIGKLTRLAVLVILAQLVFTGIK